ncbi:MAG TPA: serine hydrolase domain-containing protein, partial [Acidimicrobiales bacterium]|nr:serine hydrolase domain-containing protein [Acidimicrobiales bacterium]
MEDVAAKVGLSASRLDRIGRHFRRYVDDGRLAGVSTLVSRRGEVAHRFTYGWRDLEARAPMTEDTIVRIYSMTKPVTTVGLLTLYEEGRFSLGDPVSAFLPALGELRVFDGGDAAAYRTRPPEREVTVVDLLTHTAGLTYWFQEQSPVDDLYRRAGVDRDSCPDLATMVARLGELPLVFSPGTRWNYSVATDVVGRLIEVIAGQPLDRFLAERVIGPLGMVDTGFSVPADRLDRLAANYRRGPDGTLERVDGTTTSSFARPPTFLSGGGGLVSTAEDYHRFCLMILNGGCVGGERILGRKTVEYLGRNHLPGG